MSDDNGAQRIRCVKDYPAVGEEVHSEPADLDIRFLFPLDLLFGVGLEHIAVCGRVEHPDERVFRIGVSRVEAFRSQLKNDTYGHILLDTELDGIALVQ